MFYSFRLLLYRMIPSRLLAPLVLDESLLAKLCQAALHSGRGELGVFGNFLGLAASVLLDVLKHSVCLFLRGFDRFSSLTVLFGAFHRLLSLGGEEVEGDLSGSLVKVFWLDGEGERFFLPR